MCGGLLFVGIRAGARSLGETAVPECFGGRRADGPTLVEGEGIARSQIHAMQMRICCDCASGGDMKMECEKSTLRPWAMP